MILLPDVVQDEYFDLTAGLTYQRQYQREKFVFWPSEAGATIVKNNKMINIGHCARAIYYVFKGYAYSNPPSENMYTIVKTGKLIEQIEIEKLKTKAKSDPKLDVIAAGYKFKDWNIDDYDFTINGEMDAIIMYDKQPICIEYKTVSDFFSINKYIKKSTLPRFSYLLQVGLYLYYARYYGDELLRKIRKCWMVILDRGVTLKARRGKKYDITLQKHSNRHYIVVNDVRTFITVEDILAKFQYVKTFIERDEEPPRDFFPYYSNEQIRTLMAFGLISKNISKDKLSKIKAAGDFQCNYCFFKDLCNKKVKPAKFTNFNPNHTIEDPVDNIILTL